MSLIESAIERAKNLTGTHRAPKLDVPVEAPRRRRVEPDAATVAARTAQARVVPVASVDAATMERNGVLPQVSDKAAQRSYRILRTRLSQRMQAQGWNTLAITATGAGEGKTLTAVNLAISLARDVNTWVYLVDLDLQHPKIASTMGLHFKKGLSDYIAGNASFEEILYNPGVERLAVIPNAHSIEHSSDQLGSPRVREFCKMIEAEQPQPIVIYDMPPLLLSDDVIKFAPNVDCMLLVVAEGRTSRASLEGAKELLKDVHLAGVVLNRASERETSAYY